MQAAVQQTCKDTGVADRQCRGRQPVAWQAGDWTSIVYPSRVEETTLSLASEPTVSIKPEARSQEKLVKCGKERGKSHLGDVT